MSPQLASTQQRPFAAALPRLVCEQVVLRPWHSNDAKGLLRMHSNPAAMRYWSTEPWEHGNMARAEEYLDRIDAGAQKGDLLQWAACLPGNSELIGTVTLYNICSTHRRCEIGYMLDQPLWGKGLGRSMVRLALKHAFTALNIHKIEADADPRNLASCRMLEAIGFQREGVLRERWRTGGELQDSAIYGLIPAEFNG